jgi:hypothetical protein
LLYFLTTIYTPKHSAFYGNENRFHFSRSLATMYLAYSPGLPGNFTSAFPRAQKPFLSIPQGTSPVNFGSRKSAPPVARHGWGTKLGIGLAACSGANFFSSLLFHGSEGVTSALEHAFKFTIAEKPMDMALTALGLGLVGLYQKSKLKRKPSR